MRNFLRYFLVVSILIRLKVRGQNENECTNTKFTLSKCYENDRYLWVIELPQTEKSCEGKSIAPPRSAPCNLACQPGRALDTETLKCANCPSGSFSLGGGQQYTFDENKPLDRIEGLTVNAIPLIGLSNDQCVKEKVWRIKGSILQGDVVMNCALDLKLRFKLVRPGSVTINYNLPTSTALGSIKSRCEFDLEFDDNVADRNSNDDTLKRSQQVNFPSTGYGIWSNKNIKILEAGDYVLTIFIMGIDTLHFPFSIRSIVIEGNTYLQECTSCPPGTYSSTTGASTCKTCPDNTVAPDSGSTECQHCRSNEYSDDSSTKCLSRPTCQKKDFQRRLKKCENQHAVFEFVPIEPKICLGEPDFSDTSTVPCGVCNPGMFKNDLKNKCEFCPAKTYSDGTKKTCETCSSELSLVVGLYYKNWDELPIYFNRTYFMFEESESLLPSLDDHSWIPSVTYISSQAIPDSLSVLSLTVVDGFVDTSFAKIARTYGTLSFKFSVECQLRCELILISEELLNDGKGGWKIINKWLLNKTLSHENIVDFSYSIPKASPVVFSWLFSGDYDSQTNDEIRIYEISVTNTKTGGSDRCVACLTANNQTTECQSCPPGSILSNGMCSKCPNSMIATRLRSTDLVPNVCQPCPMNMITDDGVSCYFPCAQKFIDELSYDFKSISTLKFHGSKLFTQKGSGYFHVFNATICGQSTVTCQKTPDPAEIKRSSDQMKIESQLCRMGVVPNENGTLNSIAYVDDFGEELVNVSFYTSKHFPPLRSDFNLTDLTLMYRSNSTSSQTSCSSRITTISLRCDRTISDEQQDNSSNEFLLQTPNGCATGTCDGCHFHFLLRTPFACPVCDEKSYRIFQGPCKFGRQEIREIPQPFCLEKLREKVEFQRCSMFSIEIQILLVVFVLIAIGLSVLVAVCWRKNRKLEYRYMQLIENANPDDDAPVDNVCAQISDEDDEVEEVQFKKTSRTKKIFDAVRFAIRKEPDNGRSDAFARDSFLLNGQSTNDA